MTKAQQFPIGARIRRDAFTDCFGVAIPAISGLVVQSVRRVEGIGIAPYYRLTAHVYGPKGFMGSVEGPERFFSSEVTA